MKTDNRPKYRVEMINQAGEWVLVARHVKEEICRREFKFTPKCYTVRLLNPQGEQVDFRKGTEF